LEGRSTKGCIVPNIQPSYNREYFLFADRGDVLIIRINQYRLSMSNDCVEILSSLYRRRNVDSPNIQPTFGNTTRSEAIATRDFPPFSGKGSLSIPINKVFSMMEIFWVGGKRVSAGRVREQ
jgi:hypothetical protein